MAKPLQCIVAVARNGVIGKAGKLPWHIPEDLAWFMDQTAGGVMIEGIGEILPYAVGVAISPVPIIAVILMTPLAVLWHIGATKLPKGQLDDDGDAVAEALTEGDPKGHAQTTGPST